MNRLVRVIGLIAGMALALDTFFNDGQALNKMILKK